MPETGVADSGSPGSSRGSRMTGGVRSFRRTMTQSACRSAGRRRRSPSAATKSARTRAAAAFSKPIRRSPSMLSPPPPGGLPRGLDLIEERAQLFPLRGGQLPLADEMRQERAQRPVTEVLGEAREAPPEHLLAPDRRLEEVRPRLAVPADEPLLLEPAEEAQDGRGMARASLRVEDAGDFARRSGAGLPEHSEDRELRLGDVLRRTGQGAPPSKA